MRRTSRGTAAVELALVVPCLVLLLGLMIAGGRVWFARETVEEAASTAARSASLARTGPEAVKEGGLAGRHVLRTGGFGCADQSVRVDAGAFAVPVGQPATVTTRVACTVTFGDLLLPGMPGQMTITAVGSSALDTYRERR
ncbi:pilus assembly protein [Microlunatus panaciterrae]|uniref:Tfp pilus assembly protein FimT n=1 Tax=Microlunatus panaciterrae TaxID=400768 RepID=A0ABS2RLS6_9ACTN|nr:Tfp pilus assembly protein FimT [Microlunatus panaciterrae]